MGKSGCIPLTAALQMTLISQQCRAKCSKGARQSSIRGMKSQLASPRARESLFWGWDRAGSSKSAKRAAVRGTAKAWDHWGQCQTEKHCTALVLWSSGAPQMEQTKLQDWDSHMHRPAAKPTHRDTSCPHQHLLWQQEPVHPRCQRSYPKKCPSRAAAPLGCKQCVPQES